MNDDDQMLRLRDSAVAWREVNGEVIAIELATSTYISTNKSATPLWLALADGTTRAKLTTLLVDRYGLDPAEARADVDVYVDQLAARGLIE